MASQKNNKAAFVAAFAVILTAFMLSAAFLPFIHSDSDATDADVSLGASPDVEIAWKEVMGGPSTDTFEAVIAVTGGFVAVGSSYFGTPMSGEMSALTPNGQSDGIIVMFDYDGNVVWINNFGGTGADYFLDVTASSAGILAVGSSYFTSFGNGDLTGLTAKSSGQDWIAVLYDYSGNLIWSKNYGGNTYNGLYAAASTDTGFVLAGTVALNSAAFNSGDWASLIGNSGNNAGVLMSIDTTGTVLWVTAVGDGSVGQVSGFNDVSAITDGIIAVGSANAATISAYSGLTPNGGIDAIGAFFDYDGNLMSMSNHYAGPSGSPSYFLSVAANDNMVIAAGMSANTTNTFQMFAVASDLNNSGALMWEKTYPTPNAAQISSVTLTDNGILVAGSITTFFDSMSWIEFRSAAVMMLDFDGNELWTIQFGGHIGTDLFSGIAVDGDAFLAVGNSDTAAFGTGDWTGITGYGNADATAAFFIPSIPVPEQFIVQFDVQGGTFVPMQTVNDGNPLNSFTQPTKDGYTLRGWAIDPAGGRMWDLSNQVNRSLVLYAIWEGGIGGGDPGGSGTGSGGIGSLEDTIIVPMGLILGLFAAFAVAGVCLGLGRYLIGCAIAGVSILVFIVMMLFGGI